MVSVREAPVRRIASGRDPGSRRPSRGRYAWAASVVLVGLLGALQWSFAVLRATEAEADGFGRADVPSALTVELHPGTWYLYEEAGASVHDVEVVGPDGGVVPVSDVSRGFIDFTAYDRNGSTARAVGVFRIAPGAMGEYRIEVAGEDEFGDGTFAVGESDIADFRRNQTAGLLTVLLVTSLTGLAIAVDTFVRRRSAAT